MFELDQSVNMALIIRKAEAAINKKTVDGHLLAGPGM